VSFFFATKFGLLFGFGFGLREKNFFKTFLNAFWVTREEFFQNVFERARREEGEDVNLANLFSLSIRCLIVVCVCADAS
jgi:hypothetical protein